MDGTVILFHSLSRSTKRASDSDGKIRCEATCWVFAIKRWKQSPSRSLGGTGGTNLGPYLQSTQCARMPAARNPACSLQIQQVIESCTNLRQRASVEHCTWPLLWPWTRLWRIRHLLCYAPLPRLGLPALCKSARVSYAGRRVDWVVVVW